MCRRPQTRVVIRGRALETPSARPTATRVWCAGCGTSYDLTTEQLMLEGFECDCGKLRMPARFELSEIGDAGT